MIVAVLFAHSVLAIHYCWPDNYEDGNVGAWRDQRTTSGEIWDGVRSEQDLVSAIAPENTGIAHPMQIVLPNDDFIGWGTVNGVGTGSGCPTDYTGWNIYVDGFSFGVPFCRQTYGSLNGNEQDELFIVRYDTASCPNKWGASHNGLNKTCQALDGDIAGVLAVGSEVMVTTGQLNANIHYYNLKRHLVATQVWYAWTNGYGHNCASGGYFVSIAAPDDITTGANP